MPATSTDRKKTQEDMEIDTRKNASIEYTRDVLSRTHTIKTGKTPGFGHSIAAVEFSSQKAKAVRLSAYSFPVFVIHKAKPVKGSSISENVEGSTVVTRRDSDLE